MGCGVGRAVVSLRVLGTDGACVAQARWPVAEATDQGVVLVSALQDIITFAAIDAIIAARSVDGIVTDHAAERIVSTTTVDRVVTTM